MDSFSPDGTLEYLRAHLRHPQVRFCSHPPGLYACWNHGFAQISAEYAYLSTIGDLITRDRPATAVAGRRKPALRRGIEQTALLWHRRTPLPDIDWPIDDMIRTLGITEPRRLHKLETVLFAITNLTGALTGSCASNLFRTEVLHRHPFPTDFGTSGDAAWGIRRAADLAWGVVPERFSSFLKHPTNASPAERASYEQAPRFDQVAREMVAAARQAGTLSDAEVNRLQVDDLLEAASAYLDAKSQVRSVAQEQAALDSPAASLARSRGPPTGCRPAAGPQSTSPPHPRHTARRGLVACFGTPLLPSSGRGRSVRAIQFGRDPPS